MSLYSLISSFVQVLFPYYLKYFLPQKLLTKHVLDVWPCLCFIVKIHARRSSCDSLQKGSHLGSGHACWSQSVRLLVFQVEFIFAILKTNVVFLKHILKISIIGMPDHCVVKNLAHT